MRIGVDTGGTFTDFVVLHEDGRLQSFKLRSSPENPASVILAGISQAVGAGAAEVVHGSTVATNALLERKGARTAFVTTAGFEDIFHIGRQNRAELYNLTPVPREPLISREHCFGVVERSLFDGSVLQFPERGAVAELRERLLREKFEAVAICFLHSYQNAGNEQRVAEWLGDGFYCTQSNEICPEHREYERASTTILNSYVGPLMDRYLRQLEEGCPFPISIMQSNGGLMTAGEARSQAVRTLLSGPAGGVVGAIETARRSGFGQVLGFDMGGTSTDVSLCEDSPQFTTEAYVEGFPVRVPMLDIHTVGAGGGSIAYVDAGGLLRVGPESAGAVPGPACYGSGERATVTDAHVVLGRIGVAQLAGGSLTIAPERAEAAVDRVAAALGLSRVQTAAGILRVANANMERAIRNVSVERGYDPREFTLVAFGGCGGLHACEIAGELGMSRVLVPQFAGALSALGMLLADRARDYAAGVLGPASLAESFAALENAARVDLPNAVLARFVDVRYLGQSYELTVPWSEDGLEAAFHAMHEQRYGYADHSRSIEWITVRVRAVERVSAVELKRIAASEPAQQKVRRMFVDGRWRRLPVIDRNGIQRDLAGPALIIDYGATTLVPPGWSALVDGVGNLVISRIP